MNKNLFRPLLIVALFTLVVSCGPSQESIATMTASAWTPTPPPPTPEPYDLSVSLVDGDGNPITMAFLMVEELDMDPMAVGDDGVAVFNDLPHEVAVEVVNLTIDAQGYFPLEKEATLVRGKNELVVTVEDRNPNEMLPSEVCAPGQKVLYLEDFEDGFAQGWDAISRPLWEFEDVEERGKVLTYTELNQEGGWGTQITKKEDFGNLVWKMDLINGGDVWFYVHGNEDGRVYVIRFNPTVEGVQLWHEENQEHHAAAYRGYNEIGDWENIAIAYYEGSLEFWINGELYVALDDPDPVETGSVYLRVQATGSATTFDNIVICELSEPYAPPAVEEDAE